MHHTSTLSNTLCTTDHGNTEHLSLLICNSICNQFECCAVTKLHTHTHTHTHTHAHIHTANTQVAPNTRISGRSLSFLLKAVQAAHLVSLDLRHTYADERVADVVLNGALPSLRELDLRGCLRMPFTVVTCPTLRVYKFMWEDECEQESWLDPRECISLRSRMLMFVVPLYVCR